MIYVLHVQQASLIDAIRITSVISKLGKKKKKALSTETREKARGDRTKKKNTFAFERTFIFLLLLHYYSVQIY